MYALIDRAFPIGDIPCKTSAGSAIIHMICNNLDPKVAQFPEELVTYGGNGQVLTNWAQVRTYSCVRAVDVEICMRSSKWELFFYIFSCPYHYQQ